MKRLALLVVLMTLATNSQATVYDLGTVGQTYTITEPHLLQGLMTRLKQAEASGELAKMEKQLKTRYQAYARRPNGIDLPRAREPRQRYHDPSVRLDAPITDHEGRELWPAGMVVNPLEYITLSQQWLFFNGDDPAQAKWVRDYLKRHPEQVRPILTQGAVIDLMEQWQQRLYFDQGGKHSERLGIRALPSLVSQEGKVLRIDEIVVGDGNG